MVTDFISWLHFITLHDYISLSWQPRVGNDYLLCIIYPYYLSWELFAFLFEFRFCVVARENINKINMEKRNVDEILSGSLPEKSKELYIKKWEEFVTFKGDREKPTETDFLQYFDYLRTNSKLKASSLWNTYSMLNAMLQREFGEKLQIYPRVTQLLKSYNANYTRKVASVFEKEQIYLIALKRFIMWNKKNKITYSTVIKCLYFISMTSRNIISLAPSSLEK